MVPLTVMFNYICATKFLSYFVLINGKAEVACTFCRSRGPNAKWNGVSGLRISLGWESAKNVLSGMKMRRSSVSKWFWNAKHPGVLIPGTKLWRFGVRAFQHAFETPNTLAFRDLEFVPNTKNGRKSFCLGWICGVSAFQHAFETPNTLAFQNLGSRIFCLHR